VRTLAHNIPSLELEYGTLVPMRYMHMGVPQDQKFNVVSIAAWCAWHRLQDSFTFGAAVRRAIEKSDRKVLVLASGSLSHRFSDDRDAEANIHNWTREFDKQVDLHVVNLWRQGRWKSSAPCSRTTPSTVSAKARCMTPPCSSACLADRLRQARRNHYRALR
jgi:3,4-dihydroxyphenylacetate 2,3-dioxygenase